MNFGGFQLEVGSIGGAINHITSYNSNAIIHGLRTPNEGINQKNLKKGADVADKICCRHT